MKMLQKLNKYMEKDNFCLTDVWAALVVACMVNEIDEDNLSMQRSNYTNNPYPIYTVIDKECKHDELYAGLCGSAAADEQEIWKAINEYFSSWNIFRFSATPEMQTYCLSSAQLEVQTHGPEPAHPQEGQEECEKLLALIGLYVSAMANEDPTKYINILDNLLEDDQKIDTQTVEMASKRTISEAELEKYTERVCSSLSDLFDENKPVSSTVFLNDEKSLTPVRMTATTLCCTSVKSVFNSSSKLINVLWNWIWGRTYNHLHNMTVEGVDPNVLKAQTRDYIDAGLLHNSPYFSVLRKERDIDLIISLDFSAGDPFETVKQTAKTCEALQIPFPAVPREGKTEPKDFYVFKDDTEAPTVIHIPLFNGVNCKGERKKWENTYPTFKTSYHHSQMTDLLQKAGLNIKNNKENLLKEIENIIKEKRTSKIA
ncbi:hypothetical protein MHYP_G00312460 [Metynnis hypsauchen]